MSSSPGPRLARSLWSIAAAGLVAGLPTAPAWAQYKVVNADGSVTYTDRIPTPSSNARVTQLGRSGAPAAAAPEPGLPVELRQAVQRHPVVLYTAPDCTPCESARQFLLRRGVPYRERSAGTDEDALALERIVGARTVPALMVGQQPLRGYSETDWSAYLDAAGYPRESRLPRGWAPPPVAPLVERAAAAPQRAAAPAAPAAETATAEPAPAGGSVRF